MKQQTPENKQAKVIGLINTAQYSTLDYSKKPKILFPLQQRVSLAFSDVVRPISLCKFSLKAIKNFGIVVSNLQFSTFSALLILGLPVSSVQVLC